MSSRPCPNCGQPVSPWARYCVNCGTSLDQPSIATSAPAEAGPGERRAVSWRAIEGIPVQVLAILVTALVSLPIAAVVADRDLVTLIGIIVNEAALAVIVVMWARARQRGEPWSALGLQGFNRENVAVGLKFAGLGFVAAYGAGIVVVQVIERVTGNPVEQPEQIPLDASPTGWRLLLVALGVVILAPIAEEMFFRGFVFRALRRWAKPWPATLLSAAVFAVAHVIPLVMPPIFVLGILLARVVEKRKSLVPAIVAHMAFNAVGFVLQFLAFTRA